MFDVPKLTDAIITALIAIGLAALGAISSEALAVVWLSGAGIFLGIMVFTLWRLYTQTMGELLDRQANFMDVFNRGDEEARRAMAFQFPYMRYHMKRGIVRPYVGDTQVPVSMFLDFLRDSNKQYISPRRNWYTADRPEWAWLEIVLWLEENDKIIPDSAAGSHSILWKGSAYQQLMAYWMAGRKLVDMGETRVFSSDIPTPPPPEEAEEV